ncbi:MAG: PcfB family protein [Erysipelotrichaceae bacterium]|nr:PcfB family protein [Erysipelotrichaceae bacterium]
MNPGGDTADQMMKMTLEGIEVASRIVLSAGGNVSKSLAATLYAILTDNKKVRGKTRLDTMLKSGKELKVFAIRHDDLKTFCTEAKRYGVLYSVLKEKNNTNGICDIMVRAEDAAKISRIVDKFELATIDIKALRESINANQKPFEGVPKLTEEQHKQLVDNLQNELQNPAFARKEASDNLSERTSSTLEDKKIGRNSVRKELSKIKEKRAKVPTKEVFKQKTQKKVKVR